MTVSVFKLAPAPLPMTKVPVFVQVEPPPVTTTALLSERPLPIVADVLYSAAPLLTMTWLPPAEPGPLFWPTASAPLLRQTEPVSVKVATLYQLLLFAPMFAPTL